jgi:hypothetical protein
LLIDLLKNLATREGLNLDYKSYDWVKKIVKVPKPITEKSPLGNPRDTGLIIAEKLLALNNENIAPQGVEE